MQVGDLVKLSSYGKSVKSNSRFIGPNDLGMIISISSKRDSEFPYEVRWIQTDQNYYDLMPKLHSRQDLKYAR
tara:strand:- start:529 stop:747 length:219 start_codon:yes stop_codon:yes gene_type:complete